jgi:ATP-binding cassette subfamily C (CFTR/MRP) protein 4
MESERVVVANRFRLTNNTLKIYMTKCCVFLSVLATVLTGTPLTSQYVFALTNLYESIKNSINIALPAAVIIFPEALVSIQRIKEFLLRTHNDSNNLIKANGKPDKVDNCIDKRHQIFQNKNTGVYIKNLGIKWDRSLSNYVLKNINFHASLGELVGVIGKAGSGKSTLLQVIIKELDPVKGTREVEGTTSYACQEPWIFSASIRQNILFGQNFDSEKYQKVIKVCALEHDIFLFPYGDQTLVGERGVMLSGGQKARISLARAVYRDADIYLLDDPLSAVDANVAQQIFNKCILDHLRNKCVVLVTHQIQYLRNVDRIYLLETGTIIDSGKYENLVGLDKYFTENNGERFAETVDSPGLKVYNLPLETKEHRSSGTTDKKIYGAYCTAAGHWLFTCLVFLLFTLARLWGSFLDIFLTFWVNLEQEAAYLTSELSKMFTTSNCLYTFAGLLMCFILTSHISALLFSKFCSKASKNLHNNMLITILNTTMTFFNHHPSGRILNRFSKDMGSIDEEIPVSLMNSIMALLTVLATLVIVVVTNYWMIIPTVLLLIFCAFYFIIFQSTSRNLKRTEGISTSL